MESLTDIELVEKAAREGNELAWQEILNRYKYIAYYYSQKIFHVSVDQDDIIQEGLIGIYNAVINYDKSYRIPFKTFAKICVERNIVIFLKTKNRKKHKPLNNYESLFQSAYGEKETVRIMLIDTLQTKKH